MCHIVFGLLACGWAGLAVSCDSQTNGPDATASIYGRRASSETIWWTSQGKGFGEWGLSPDGFYATSVGPDSLDCWRWQGAKLHKYVSVTRPRLIGFVFMGSEKGLCELKPPTEYADWPLVLVDIPSFQVLAEWKPEPHWEYATAGASRNGLLAAFIYRQTPGGEHGISRFGLLNPQNQQIRWVGELTGEGFSTLCHIVVSDDGEYLAAVGWSNGVAVLSRIATESALESAAA